MKSDVLVRYPKLQQLPPDRRELVKALINVLAEKK